MSKLTAPGVAILIGMPALNACGDSNEPVNLSSVTDDHVNIPFDEDPTDTTGGQGHELIPTTGEGCPGIDDLCVYGPQGDTEEEKRKVWECQGEAEFRYHWSQGVAIPEITFDVNSFGEYDGKFPDVMACCNDVNEVDGTEGYAYEFGCENSNPVFKPQPENCLKDCAFQLCRRFVLEFKYYLDTKAMEDGDSNELYEIYDYINKHSSECQKVLLARNACDDVELGSCDDGLLRFVGRWEFGKPGWGTFQDFQFDAKCNISDWNVASGNYVCDGVQANNALPFPDVKPGIGLVYSFIVDVLDGSVSAVVDETPIEEAEIVMSDVQFRKQLDCDLTAPCAFYLDQMRVSLEEEVDLGFLSIVDGQGQLLMSAVGTHTGDGATLPTSSIQMVVVGHIESSTFPLLDGLPFGWIVFNSSPVTLYVTESPTAVSPLFGIEATFGSGMIPSEFYLETDRAEYTFAP